MKPLQNFCPRSSTSNQSEVIYKQPKFKEAPENLLYATKGIDIKDLSKEQQRYQQLKEALLKSEYEGLKLLIKSNMPENFLFCPHCYVSVKAKNLLNHFEKHRRGIIKT